MVYELACASSYEEMNDLKVSDAENPTMGEATAIKLLKDYMERTGKKQGEVGRELGGLSGSLVSQFLSGTYKTPHTLIPKVEKLLQHNEKKAASPKAPGFKMTSISQHVTNIITYCHLQGKIGVAYGDAGIGKTMAAREYMKNNPEAIMITISPCFATITGVNELLADELKIKEKVTRRIYAETVNKLRGSNRVIIVDEAQHLTVRVINHLRSITDESGIGIAFIGNEEIYLKMRGAGQASYAQLFSRIGDKAHVLTADMKLKDIRMVFDEAALEKDALEVLHAISKTNYGLRGAVNVYVNVIIAFEINDYKELTAARLAKMAKEMSIA